MNARLCEFFPIRGTFRSSLLDLVSKSQMSDIK